MRPGGGGEREVGVGRAHGLERAAVERDLRRGERLGPVGRVCGVRLVDHADQIAGDHRRVEPHRDARRAARGHRLAHRGVLVAGRLHHHRVRPGGEREAERSRGVGGRRLAAGGHRRAGEVGGRGRGLVDRALERPGGRLRRRVAAVDEAGDRVHVGETVAVAGPVVEDALAVVVHVAARLVAVRVVEQHRVHGGHVADDDLVVACGGDGREDHERLLGGDLGLQLGPGGRPVHRRGQPVVAQELRHVALGVEAAGVADIAVGPIPDARRGGRGDVEGAALGVDLRDVAAPVAHVGRRGGAGAVPVRQDAAEGDGHHRGGRPAGPLPVEVVGRVVDLVQVRHPGDLLGRERAQGARGPARLGRAVVDLPPRLHLERAREADRPAGERRDDQLAPVVLGGPHAPAAAAPGEPLAVGREGGRGLAGAGPLDERREARPIEAHREDAGRDR